MLFAAFAKHSNLGRERAGDGLFLGMAETDEEKLEILGDDFSSI